MIHDEWQKTLTGEAPAAQAAGIAYLPELAVVRFTGADVGRFLQGYLTCDTADLVPGRLTPTALCSLKGRVVMNGWCTPAVDRDDTVLLVMHRSLTGRLAEFLKAYLRFSRTELEDLTTSMLVLGSLDLAAGDDGLVLDARRRLFLCADLETARTLWDAHAHTTDTAWLAALTADGIPLVSEAVSERFLPQMLDLERLGAVDFEKGCYLGQEVVARAQHRGQVKRRLTRLTWAGSSAAPTSGSDVTDGDGRVVGTIVQSARADAQGGPALAVLGREVPHVLNQGDVRLNPRP